MTTTGTDVFRLEEAIQLLRRTPRALAALLDGVAAAWLRADEGPGTWSAHEVLAHLVDLEEMDWMRRLGVILDQGESATFVPIDRERFHTSLASRGTGELLALFVERRRDNVAALERLRLTDADLDRRARHPEFGPVTARQLLATWTVHDLTHLSQISRVLARRYADAVGPWKAYLSIVSRDLRT